jgi:predicted PurR-regulated permease PerM
MSRRMPRTAAVILALLLEVLVLAIMVFTVLPLLLRELSMAIEKTPAFLGHLNATLAPWIAAKTGFAVNLDPDVLKVQMGEMIKTTEGLGGKLLNSLRLGGLGLVGLLANLVLVPVVQFYLMRDWEEMQQRITRLIPPGRRKAVGNFIAEADEALGQYLHGQMLVILVMAGFYTIALWFTGLEFFLPIGIITGVLVFVPYLGSITGLMLAMLAALMQFSEWTGVAWVLAVFVTGQLIEGYIVVPKLVGERIGLHPLAVIFALLAFGEVFGFLGLLLALPASAVLLVALRKVKAHYLKSDLYKGPEKDPTVKIISTDETANHRDDAT